MDYLTQIVIAALMCAALGILFWILKGKMITPVKAYGDFRLAMVIRVSGEAPELEHTVDGLLWLCDNGTADFDIIIADSGLETDARKMTELIVKKSRRITLCSITDLPYILADMK